jgi:prepilin-type N-terminal cleavage/methylation domain-containing protein
MMNGQKNIALLFTDQDARGFTLIEMLVSMTMGLLILAGLTSMFVSMNDASRAVSSRSDRMGDLYLASHIMQAELRESKNLCWDAAKNRIIYEPLDSSNPLIIKTCNTVNPTNGSFEFRPAKTGKPTPYICWDRPNKGDGCQELIRDMSAPNPSNPSTPPNPLGLIATQSANLIWTITLTSSYLNENKANKTLSLRFKTWKRN